LSLTITHNGVMIKGVSYTGESSLSESVSVFGKLIWVHLKRPIINPDVTRLTDEFDVVSITDELTVRRFYG